MARFNLDPETANALLEKLDGEARKLAERIFKAVECGPDSNVTGHLVGQGTEAIRRGGWKGVSVEELGGAVGKSPGTLHGCAGVARCWTEDEVKRIDLPLSHLIEISRVQRLHDPERARSARDRLVEAAEGKGLSVRELKELVKKLLERDKDIDLSDVGLGGDEQGLPRGSIEAKDDRQRGGGTGEKA